MVASNEKASLDKVLVHEGGWSNNPKDPGGATMKGVIQRTYNAYRKRKGLSTQSVRNISDAELQEIYDTQYWDAIKGDDLPIGVDYAVLDGAVNSGVSRSIKWLQMALRPAYQGSIDGMMGTQTLQALQEDPNNDALIDRMLNERMKFLKRLSTWSTFGRGWTSRVNDVRAAAQAWATGAEHIPAATYAEGGHAKALVADAKPAPMTAPADVTATIGGTGLGVSATLDNLQSQISPFASAHDWIGQAVVIIAAASAVLAIGGIAYGQYARYKARKLVAVMTPEAA